MGVHRFEPHDARGGVLDIGLSIGSSIRAGWVSQQE